jgi:RHS repeat-associated protein
MTIRKNPYYSLFLRKNLSALDEKNVRRAELDEYYYGARYYNPRESVWLSVDPLFEKTMTPYQYTYQNPLKFIDPNGEEPTPEEAARMAAHVYGDKKDDILIGGWRVSNSDFGIQLQDETGLKSLVYERVINGKVTEYTYATAGTENWKDWGENAKQPLGLSDQYHNAAENAKALSKALSKTELNFVGHSLGGGEAALNSLITSNDKLIGRKAFTFNAAGVGNITKMVEGTCSTPFKSEKNIQAYILLTDPLNKLQNGNSPLGKIMPDVNGNRHYLLPKDLPSVYNGHSMDNVLKNFGIKNSDVYNK